jgi:cytochrome c556
MRYLCWIIAALLAAHVVYFYGLYDRTRDLPFSEDDRTPVELTPAERDAVLVEMRRFLQSVQEITRAMAEGEPRALAEAARASGAAARQQVPASVMEKLPAEFKRLGLDTHQRFDRLAMDVEELDDTAPAEGQLPALLQNCVACHAAYRLDPVRSP